MTLIERSEADAAPRVAILLFDRAEIIDFAGPWEVFGGAGYKVFTVAEKTDPVNCVYGQRVVADFTFDNSPQADILLVPGGGVGNAVNDPTLIKWVQGNAARATHVMSVCTGAFILAKAGLLDGLTATTVRGGIDSLASAGKNIKTVYDKRYVDNGKVITTAGLSSGIDGALHLVSKIDGLGTAQQVALDIEYDWDPRGKFARAALADRYLPNFKGLDGKITVIDGNTDRWETTALIKDPPSVSGIVDVVQKQIISGTPHRSSPVTITRVASKTLDKTTFEWRFKDERTRVWAGSCSVSESVARKGQFELTVRLVKV
jgi:putative intracellular protease/amidase